ncbi:hypothetical protein [Streptomyces wedmorensis]
MGPSLLAAVRNGAARYAVAPGESRLSRTGGAGGTADEAPAPRSPPA